MRMGMGCQGLLGALLCVAGCGSKAAGGAGSAAASGAAAPGSGAPAASASAAPAKDASAYSVVATAGDAMILTRLGPGAIAQISGLFFVLGEGPLAQEPGRMLGLKKGGSLEVVGGEWPKAAYALGASNEGGKQLYRWYDTLGGRWAEQVTPLRDGEKFLSVASVGESVVAAIAMTNNDIRTHLMGGKGGVLPAPKGRKKAEPAPAGSASAGPSAEAPPEPAPPPPSEDGAPAAPEEDKSCKVEMSPEGPYLLAGAPSGHAYAAGFECQDAGGVGKALVERWEPKKGRGVIEPLPDAAGLSLGGVVAISGAEAWVWGAVSGAPYLARWDGKAWAHEKAPTAKALRDVTAAPDGQLFLAADEGLFTRKPGGAWEKVALPAAAGPFEPRAVFARTAADVWVYGRSENKHVLLRSQKVDKVAEMPAESEVEKQFRVNARHVASPLCAKPYAHLWTIGPKASPVPKGSPMLDKAFAGKKFEGATLIVEEDGANLHAGAKAPTVAAAEAIVKAFKDANPKMLPQVFCHDPKPKAELAWP